MSNDDPMTLGQAIAVLEDDLAATSSTPELDPDGNRIGPDTPAEWEGMDHDPPMVLVDLEAAWFLLDHVREAGALRDDLAAISKWCHGIARKADAQGNDPLALTAPRIAEEIDRALTGAPLAYARYTPVEGTEEVLTWLRANGKLP